MTPPISRLPHIGYSVDRLHKVAANWNRVRAPLYAGAKDYTTIAGLDLSADISGEVGILLRLLGYMVFYTFSTSQLRGKGSGSSYDKIFPRDYSRFFTPYLPTQEATEAMGYWFSIRDRKCIFSRN